MNISLAAEPVFYFLGIPITNTLIATWVVMGILTLFAFLVIRKTSLIPQGWQSLFEEIFQVFLELAEAVAVGRARMFLPLVFSFFIFILTANWFGLLPFVGSIGFYEIIHGERVFVPFLRGATSDLNTTLALALVSVGAIQYYGVKTLHLSYFKRFFDLSSPINLFVGILELISDFAKVISFSFRLFGNIFAGEVLLAVIAFLIPLVGSLPFFGLELFVGFIQALVFAMLTLVFLNVATATHGREV